MKNTYLILLFSITLFSNSMDNSRVDKEILSPELRLELNEIATSIPCIKKNDKRDGSDVVMNKETILPIHEPHKAKKAIALSNEKSKNNDIEGNIESSSSTESEEECGEKERHRSCCFRHRRALIFTKNIIQVALETGAMSLGLTKASRIKLGAQKCGAVDPECYRNIEKKAAPWEGLFGISMILTGFLEAFTCMCECKRKSSYKLLPRFIGLVVGITGGVLLGYYI